MLYHNLDRVHCIQLGTNFGWNIIGIGGDYNGASYFPHDLANVGEYPNFFAKLIERLENETTKTQEEIKVKLLSVVSSHFHYENFIGNHQWNRNEKHIACLESRRGKIC